MQVKPFDKRIYLASPTMHGEEQMYVKEAFDTNWVSTVGANLNALESDLKYDRTLDFKKVLKIKR